MYYYVFEQPENKKVEKLQERIRINLDELRIVGEITKSNPVQKPEELVRSGIAKGYNTIVIVGSDGLINRMATYIAGQDITLGIIPTDAGSKFLSLIGAKNITSACEILPFRRIMKIDIGRVEDNRFFLNKIDLVPAVQKGLGPKGADLDSAAAVINFGDYQARVRAGRITIENGSLEINQFKTIKESFSDGLLNVYTAPPPEKEDGFFSKLFKKEYQPKPFNTVFHVKKLKVSASPLMAVISGDKIVGKTPIEISIIPNFLKIIVSRIKEE